MTEQYKDRYQEQYNKETAQIHAPQGLIERTKAAMREEEKRLAQTAVPKSAAEASLEMTYANDSRQSRRFTARSWAYPLTAAAALLILVSVSVTMRGLNSKNMAPAADTAYSGAAENGAVYEAADEAFEERPMEAPAAFAEAPMMEEEAFEEAAAEDMDMMADMAEGADAGQTNGLSREESNADMAALAEEKTTETESEDAIKEAAISKKQEAAESGAADDAANEDNFATEEVTKRPVRFTGADVKIHRYEGKTFRVLKKKGQENTWEAYVEITAGKGYVICGEAESAEDFLAGAWEKLEEEK